MTRCIGRYVFPLDSKSAVAAFESEVDGVVSTAQVREKQEAQREFDAAVSSGGSAQLLLQETPDIFQSKIGGKRGANGAGRERERESVCVCVRKRERERNAHYQSYQSDK